jgi:hypothetical protein
MPIELFTRGLPPPLLHWSNEEPGPTVPWGVIVTDVLPEAKLKSVRPNVPLVDAVRHCAERTVGDPSPWRTAAVAEVIRQEIPARTEIITALCELLAGQVGVAVTAPIGWPPNVVQPASVGAQLFGSVFV